MICFNDSDKSTFIQIFQSTRSGILILLISKVKKKYFLNIWGKSKKNKNLINPNRYQMGYFHCHNFGRIFFSMVRITEL